MPVWEVIFDSRAPLRNPRREIASKAGVSLVGVSREGVPYSVREAARGNLFPCIAYGVNHPVHLREVGVSASARNPLRFHLRNRMFSIDSAYRVKKRDRCHTDPFLRYRNTDPPLRSR